MILNICKHAYSTPNLYLGVFLSSIHKQVYKPLPAPLNITAHSRLPISSFVAGISHYSANDNAESIQLLSSLTTSRRRLILPPVILRRRLPIILRRRLPVILRRRLPVILRRRLPIILRRRLPVILRRRLPIILRRRLPIILRRRLPIILRRRTPTTSRRRRRSSGTIKSTDKRSIKIEIPIGGAVGGLGAVTLVVFLVAHFVFKVDFKKICCGGG